MKKAFAKSRQPPKPRVRPTLGRAPAPPAPAASRFGPTWRTAKAVVMMLIGAGLFAYWLQAPAAAAPGREVFMIAVVVFAIGISALFPASGRSRSGRVSSSSSSSDGWSSDSSWGSSDCDSGGGDSGGGGGGDGGGGD